MAKQTNRNSKKSSSYFHSSTALVAIISGFIYIGFFDPINWPKQIALLTLIPVIFARARFAFKTEEIPVFFRAKKSLLVIPFFLISVSAILSTIMNDHSLTRLLWGLWGRNNGLLTLLALLIIALSFSFFAQEKNVTWSILRTIEVAALFYIGYGLIQLFGKDTIKWAQQNQVFSFFGNTNFAAAVFAMCAITYLLTAIFMAQQSVVARILRFIFFTTATYLSYSTKSIQGLAAILIAILLIVFVKLNLKKVSQRIFLATALFLTGFYVFLGTLGYGALGSLIGQYTIQLRFQYWLAGIRMGLQSPIWGVGPDSYGDKFRTVRPESLALKTSIDLTTNNAHNVLIQLFATLGVLGLLAILIPVAFGFFFSTKMLLSQNFSTEERATSILFISLWSMAMFSIDNLSIAVWNYLFLGLTLGTYLRSSQNSSRDHIPEKVIAKRNSRTMEHSLSGPLAGIIALAIFGVSWYCSYPDRTLQQILGTQVDQQKPDQVASKTDRIMKIAGHPFVSEVEYWYLASELNKLGKKDELVQLLSMSISKYPNDFNIIDINAGSREQSGQLIQAIPFRERQITIEPRHPRVWLSYAFDLNAAGRNSEASLAFGKVLRFKEFLDAQTISQLPEIAKQLGISYSG